MELPHCPICREGRLIPLSEENKAYAYWICSMPDCAYTIGRNVTAEYFYKGTARSVEKEKEGKKWKEYEF